MGLCEVDLVNPFTYGYARSSIAERDENNLETQIEQPDKYGVRRDLFFADNGSGIMFNRSGWKGLINRVHPATSSSTPTLPDWSGIRGKRRHSA